MLPIDMNIHRVHECTGSRQVWSGQVHSACISMLQVGGPEGMLPKIFWNLEAMRLLLRPILGQSLPIQSGV